MPLDTEVGLVPSDIVLDGDPAPRGKGHSSPHFSAHFALARSPMSATAELLYFILCSFVRSAFNKHISIIQCLFCRTVPFLNIARNLQKKIFGIFYEPGALGL